jgi:hypothetical protein
MDRARAGTGAAMQKEHRLAHGVAHLLPIHDVAIRERQKTGLEGGNIGKEVATGHKVFIRCRPL